MKTFGKMMIVAGMALALPACGKPTVIDMMKRAHLAECPNHEIGSIVNGYYQTTSWSAYRTDVEAVKRITAEGEVMYIGSTVNAQLEFLFNEETGDATLQSVSFNGEEQLRPFAEALISNMCEKAR